MRVLLLVYDNGSYIHATPMAMMYVASAFRNAGHEVEVYNQDLYRWPASHLTEYLTANRFDAVGLSLVGGYYPYRKLLEISEAVNAVPNRPYYILGGHGPSPEPEYFLKKSGADAVVVGEGEISGPKLLAALEHRTPLSAVDGIAYLDDNGKLVQTSPQAQIADIDSIPFPARDLFPMEYYMLGRIGNVTESTDRLAHVLSGRGCSFKCSFCYRMEEGCRVRSPENIVEELRQLKADYNVNFVMFSDELLMTSEARTEAICNAFIEANLGIRWGCNGRLNYASPAVLRLMKQAGCVFINYGIEAMDDNVLRAMHKCLTVDVIHKGIENTLAEGIHPGFNIIFGNIGDNKEVLRKDVEFLLKYDDQGQMRTIRPVTPYPGTPLYRRAIANGLLEGAADFYENKSLNDDLLTVNFTEMSDSEFHEALCEANKTLLANYYEKQKAKALATCDRLYKQRDNNFRGFRQT